MSTLLLFWQMMHSQNQVLFDTEKLQFIAPWRNYLLKPSQYIWPMLLFIAIILVCGLLDKQRFTHYVIASIVFFVAFPVAAYARSRWLTNKAPLIIDRTGIVAQGYLHTHHLGWAEISNLKVEKSWTGLNWEPIKFNLVATIPTGKQFRLLIPALSHAEQMALHQILTDLCWKHGIEFTTDYPI